MGVDRQQMMSYEKAVGHPGETGYCLTRYQKLLHPAVTIEIPQFSCFLVKTVHRSEEADTGQPFAVTLVLYAKYHVAQCSSSYS